jgi:hypothetical protein
LAVQSAELASGGFAIRWMARSGVTYRVMRSGDLLVWDEVPGGRIQGAGVEAEVVDPVLGAASRFYRVEVVP